MSLLLEQLRCECHLVRCHIPELQFVKNTLSIKPVCLLVRRLTVQILPRSVIHMVDGFTNARMPIMLAEMAIFANIVSS